MAVARALGVEDAGEEALAPVVRRGERPTCDFANRIHPVPRLSADGSDRPSAGSRGLERELAGADPLIQKEATGTYERLGISECQAEAMVGPGAAVRPLVVTRRDVSIAPDEAAEVAPPVVRGVHGHRGELPRAHQLAAEREVWAPVTALLRARHMLPTAAR